MRLINGLNKFERHFKCTYFETYKDHNIKITNSRNCFHCNRPTHKVLVYRRDFKRCLALPFVQKVLKKVKGFYLQTIVYKRFQSFSNDKTGLPTFMLDPCSV